MQQPSILQTLIVSLTILLTSCGGSSSGEFVLPLFGGEWRLSYNVVQDDCGLVSEDGIFFLDNQSIEQSDMGVTVTSEQLPLGTYTGMTRGSDSFLAEALQEGDLFGDGVFCQLSEDLAYNDLDGDTASSLYRVRIECADGFVCDSVVRGAAERS